VQRVKAFFDDIDGRWTGPPGEIIELRLIGSTALMVLTDYDRGTKDSDVLETVAIIGATKTRLLELAGQETALHRRHSMYLDIVDNGLPFLPHAPAYHAPQELNAGLGCFQIKVLDVVDVVVSKLKRYSPSDREDIHAMIQRGAVPRDDLIARFRAAVDEFACDARAVELPRYVTNLHQVERDAYGGSETEIELPAWAEE